MKRKQLLQRCPNVRYWEAIEFLRANTDAKSYNAAKQLLADLFPNKEWMDYDAGTAHPCGPDIGWP